MKLYKAVHERENKCKELHNYLLVDVDEMQKQVNALENQVNRMKRIEARRRWRYGRKNY